MVIRYGMWVSSASPKFLTLNFLLVSLFCLSPAGTTLLFEQKGRVGDSHTYLVQKLVQLSSSFTNLTDKDFGGNPKNLIPWDFYGRNSTMFGLSPTQAIPQTSPPWWVIWPSYNVGSMDPTNLTKVNSLVGVFWGFIGLVSYKLINNAWVFNKSLAHRQKWWPKMASILNSRHPNKTNRLTTY